MTTLNTVFKLFDSYSTTIDKINRKTDEMTDKILKASSSIDKFNNSMKASGSSNSKASLELGKYVDVIKETAVKGMNIADGYINTNTKLSLITNNLKEQEELQNKIFAAANRSRGSYTDMAAAVATMGITAGDVFGGNNDQLVAFTELLQKSVRISGASPSEQSSTMLQVSQSMAAGKLQGNDYQSINKNAPMFVNAIEEYMKNTMMAEGSMEDWLEQGLITAEVMKNAMFMSGDDINNKAKDLPKTFADVWNDIENGALKAFGPIIEKLNSLISNPGFTEFINGIIIGFAIIAQVAEELVDVIINGWDTIGPILAIIGGVLLAGMIGNLISMIPLWIANATAVLSFAWPILLAIGIIALLISAARQFGASWEDIFGFVGGIIGVFVADFYNQFVYIWNVVATFINFFGNVFSNPVASIKALFYDLAITAIGYITTMAQGIEDLLNTIPGIKVDITSGLDNLLANLEKASATVKSEAELVEYVKTKDFMDRSDGFSIGSNIGKDLPNNFSDTIDNFTDSLTKDDDKLNFDGFGTKSNPVAVTGTGNNDTVNVDMGDEDLQYLRDIAERDYINKFSTATLAPNIQVTFGDVHENADTNLITGKIQKILQEEIALSAEGAY